MTCDDILKVIDDFLATAEETERAHLINILTALRGPDNENKELKRATTKRIRTIAFPKAAERGRGEVWGISFAQPGERVTTLSELDPDHFGSHVVRAVESLNLIGRDAGDWHDCRIPGSTFRISQHPLDVAVNATHRDAKNHKVPAKRIADFPIGSLVELPCQCGLVRIGDSFGRYVTVTPVGEARLCGSQCCKKQPCLVAGDVEVK